MATFRDEEANDLDREEDLNEDLEDILNEIPGATHGWTPQLAETLGTEETDDEGNIIPDPNRCYEHVNCRNAYCLPASVVLARHQAEYLAELGVLRDQVTHLITNVRLVETLVAFPADFYARRHDAWHAWSIETHFVSAVLMAWRLWKDDDQRCLTIPQFRTRVIRTARPEFLGDIQGRLKECSPERLVGPALDRIHDIRNQRIGHLSRAVQLGNLPPDWPSLQDLEAVSTVYAQVLQALMFRENQHWLAEPVVYSLEAHLTEMALCSDWSRLFEEQPSVWTNVLGPEFDDLPEREYYLADLNRRRGHVGLPQIVRRF